MYLKLVAIAILSRAVVVGVVVVAVGWVVTNQDVSHKLWWLMNKWLVVVSDERESVGKNIMKGRQR